MVFAGEVDSGGGVASGGAVWWLQSKREIPGKYFPVFCLLTISKIAGWENSGGCNLSASHRNYGFMADYASMVVHTVMTDYASIAECGVILSYPFYTRLAASINDLHD